MSKYLTALKGQDFLRTNTPVLQELQKAPSYSFCSTQVLTPQKYRGAETASDPGEPCRGWELHFADREPLVVTFSDDLTHGEVLALYPAAVAAAPCKL